MEEQHLFLHLWDNQTNDAWDCKYTYIIHNNNIYDFEYAFGKEVYLEQSVNIIIFMITLTKEYIEEE